MRFRTLTTAVAAAALALPAAAHAAPPWSEPAQVPEGFAFHAPLVGFTTSGAGVLAFNGGGDDPGSYTATLGAGQAGPARRLTSGLAVTDLALYGRTRSVVVGTIPQGRELRAGVAFGRTDGSLGRPVRLSNSPSGGPVSVAATRGGDVAVAFGSQAGVQLAVRRAGRRFGTPVRMASRGDFASVAVNPRGDVLVAWRDGELIRARIRTAGGRLRDTQRLGRVAGFPHISLALSPTRRALVGWTSERVGEGVPTSEAHQWMAYAPADKPFRSALELERFDNRPSGAGMYVKGTGVRVAFTSIGQAVVAWTGRTGANHVVRTADLTAGRPGDARTLSDETVYTELDALVTGPAGELLILSTTGSERERAHTLVANVRAAGGAWSRPQLVAEGTFPEPGASLRFTAASGAIDPATRRPHAFWLRGDTSQAVMFAHREPIG